MSDSAFPGSFPFSLVRMPPAPPEPPIVVIEIDSSDDEDGIGVQPGRTPSSNLTSLPASQIRSLCKQPKIEVELESKPKIASADSHYAQQKLSDRSFWKAGAYEIGPSRFVPLQGELEHARVHPKFLHSNATSHKWAFGAIAELLDNAVDEIRNGATYVLVDKFVNPKDNSPCLLFKDDGGGMDPECLRKCMSLGYSSKTSNTTIGQYGNGFKTSTMRLGADVIVFSRSTQSGRHTQTVGLLSYTFLRKTGQDDVIVPMIDFDISDQWAEPIIYGSQDDWTSNLKIIIEWSPFESKEQLLMQFDDIGSHGSKVIIFNLWLNDEGIYELSFDDDDEDIRLRDEVNQENLAKRTLHLQSHISYRLRYSLRAYASVLYLRNLNNFNIILRGKPVEKFNIEDGLKHQKVVTYKPQLGGTSEEVLVKATIGFIKEAPELGISGFNVYHKNRLIRPFWKVTADGNSRGRGVVGILEANFISPAHDKQDFERSSIFIRLEARLKQMAVDYWKEHCHFVGYRLPDARRAHPSPVPPVSIQNQVDSNQHRIGLLASNVQEVQLSQPAIHLPASSTNNDLPIETASDDASKLDQICEENIQLFIKCEENVKRHNSLKEVIKKLEKDLEEARRRREQLAAYLESRKNQKALRQQKGKA